MNSDSAAVAILARAPNGLGSLSGTLPVQHRSPARTGRCSRAVTLGAHLPGSRRSWILNAYRHSLAYVFVPGSKTGTTTHDHVRTARSHRLVVLTTVAKPDASEGDTDPQMYWAVLVLGVVLPACVALASLLLAWVRARKRWRKLSVFHFSALHDDERAALPRRAGALPESS